MNIRLNSWNEVKTVISTHYLKLMYDEFDTYYFLYCIKGDIAWHYSLPKRESDKEPEQMEFETYYKLNATDWATKKESFLISCPPEQTTTFDIKFQKDSIDRFVWLFGGGYNIIGNVSGLTDKLNIYAVLTIDEIDNYISHFIVNENMWSFKEGRFKDPVGEYNYIPEGTKLRIVYENTSLTDTVNLDFYFIYKCIERTEI